MQNTFRLARYQLSQYKIALLIYYAVFISFAVLSNIPGTGNATASSVITIFILGLNSFKGSYKFAQANNLTRKTSYLATLLTISYLAVIMSLVDTLLDKVFKHVHLDMFGQIYPPSLGTQIVWSTMLLFFLASLGCLITMLYYRANTKIKIFISFSPILFYWLLIVVENLSEGKFGEITGNFVFWAFGASGPVLNPYPAILSFFVMSAAVWGINFLLIRRAPVKV